MTAMDVIVLVDKEGCMTSTPFNVSFVPYMSFLRQSTVERVILEINGETSEIPMLKDVDGEVLFVDDETANGANNHMKIPSPDYLQMMGLRKGENTVRFTTTVTRQSATAKVFVWSTSTKIVVTDIDGTITKSDVRGHLYSKFGMKWHHNSVSDCFTKVRDLGYQVVYLTARSVSIERLTRRYLQHLGLPAGPLFLSKKTLASAFTSEVIRKDAKFGKAEQLANILQLFPVGTNPIVAGFGNNENDNWAYQHAGIPPSHIFIVNKRSEIKVHSKSTSYDAVATEICNFFHRVLDVDVV